MLGHFLGSQKERLTPGGRRRQLDQHRRQPLGGNLGNLMVVGLTRLELFGLSMLHALEMRQERLDQQSVESRESPCGVGG
ncbi:hypothetical protein D3C86_1075560 [compost metagenome]